jgi:hypothetical protein
MSFVEQVTLAEEPEFKRRVQGAMVKSAIFVSSEDPATAGHATRVQWATQVLRDPAHYAARMAFGVAANPAITADSTDADIEFTVNSVWNAYAGVITPTEVAE